MAPRRAVPHALLALLACTATAVAGATEIERINPDGLTKPQGYSQVVVGRGERWIHVAGQGGIAKDGTVPADVGEQSRLMFEKVRIALAAAGATPADVVRIVVYIVDLPNTDPAPIYRAIREFFPEGAKPASSIVGVSALALPGMKVEIDVTAVR
ncbi:MAG: RidA family protein [Steroidobacteraceae bacterium]|jgi:enamine deaminase RidA (YjgF/YER057c/UK114 family)|nr:RidA family protein [Steroidobacteraceae bacterium]